jgi:hypothetical protein
MHQHENQQANFDNEQSHSGGAAPEHRQCQYIKADGKGCRDWAVRGQEMCYRHGVFLGAGRGIDVPLLEDESSIVLVLSETLRAVAHGAISTKGAALMLDGCRLAHSMLMERQKAANAERARRRQEREAGRSEPGAGSEEEAGSREPGAAGHRAPGTGHRTPETCALRPEPCAGVLAAQAEPLEERIEEELAVGVR